MIPSGRHLQPVVTLVCSSVVHAPHVSRETLSTRRRYHGARDSRCRVQIAGGPGHGGGSGPRCHRSESLVRATHSLTRRVGAAHMARFHVQQTHERAGVDSPHARESGCLMGITALTRNLHPLLHVQRSSIPWISSATVHGFKGAPGRLCSRAGHHEAQGGTAHGLSLRDRERHCVARETPLEGPMEVRLRRRAGPGACFS